MSLQVAGDVCGAQHLAADVARDLALVPDHVRAQAVFGGECGRAGLRHGRERGVKTAGQCNGYA